MIDGINNINEAIKYLDKELNQEDKDYLLDNGSLSVHHSLGRWIRNNFGLWAEEDTPLKSELKELGYKHPDDMSNFIIEKYIEYVKMETNNKELDYTRIKALIDKVNEFVNTLPEDMDDKNGFELLLIAHDTMNGTSGVYTLLEQTDERESLVQCIDKAISGNALKGAEKNPQEWLILNGIGEYMMRMCALFPSLYNNFKYGVDHFIKLNEEMKEDQKD